MVSPTGILIDVAKTKAISDWPVPSNLKQVQSFLSFANFYQHFIVNFSDMVIPLTRLTQKDTKFEWQLEHQTAFKKLKLAFMKAPVLSHFNPQDPIIVETDASATMLSQLFFLRFHPLMATSILSHSTLVAWHLPNSTMRFTTKNSSPFLMHSGSGKTISKD